MLEAVADRLKHQIPTLHLQGFAADLAAVDQKPPQRKPAAYILRLAEEAGENDLAAGAISQLVTSTFAVVIAVESASSQAGKVDAVENLKDDIVAALVGFSPSADHKQCEYRRYRVLQFVNATVWAEIAFATEYEIRKVS